MPLPQELLVSAKKYHLKGESRQFQLIVLCYLVQHYHVLVVFFVLFSQILNFAVLP